LDSWAWANPPWAGWSSRVIAAAGSLAAQPGNLNKLRSTRWSPACDPSCKQADVLLTTNQRSINLDIPAAELKKRLKAWTSAR
jgi:hypothetical protein